MLRSLNNIMDCNLLHLSLTPRLSQITKYEPCLIGLCLPCIVYLDMTGQWGDPVPVSQLCHDSRSQTELEIGNSPAPVDCVGGLAEIAGAHSVTTVAAWLANSQHLRLVSTFNLEF